MTQRTINLYDGLEALYYFDSDYFDGTTGEIKDKSGHGRHATANGGPTVGVNGPNDFSATRLDGVDDYVALDTPIPEPNDDHTLFVFCRLAKKDQTVIGTRNNGTDDGSSISTNNSLKVSFAVKTDSSGTIAANIFYDEKRWTPIIGVLRDSRIQIVTDQTRASAEVSSFATSSNDNLHIGRNSTASNSFVDGAVAVAAKWTRGLNEAEIQQLLRLTAPRRSQL